MSEDYARLQDDILLASRLGDQALTMKLLQEADLNSHKGKIDLTEPYCTACICGDNELAAQILNSKHFTVNQRTITTALDEFERDPTYLTSMANRANDRELRDIIIQIHDDPELEIKFEILQQLIAKICLQKKDDLISALVDYFANNNQAQGVRLLVENIRDHYPNFRKIFRAFECAAAVSEQFVEVKEYLLDLVEEINEHILESAVNIQLIQYFIKKGRLNPAQASFALECAVKSVHWRTHFHHYLDLRKIVNIQGVQMHDNDRLLFSVFDNADVELQDNFEIVDNVSPIQTVIRIHSRVLFKLLYNHDNFAQVFSKNYLGPRKDRNEIQLSICAEQLYVGLIRLAAFLRQFKSRVYVIEAPISNTKLLFTRDKIEDQLRVGLEPKRGTSDVVLMEYIHFDPSPENDLLNRLCDLLLSKE